MLTGDILVILLLLALNAFFAMSELAVVSASKPLLRQKARLGDRRAARALQLAENPGLFLSTVQVGITLIGILAGAYGGATIAQKLAPVLETIPYLKGNGEAIAVAIVVTSITFLSVIVGELVPKRLALAAPERLAMFAATPMSLLLLIFAPVVKLLDGSAHLALAAFGYRHKSENRVTEAELRAVIAEGVESGAIEASEHDMLKRIIRLGDRDVESIMTHRIDVTFIDIEEPLDEIRRKIREAGHSRYPVIEGPGTDIIGILQAKDLLDLDGIDDSASLRKLIKPVPAVSANMKCLKALELFKSSNAHMAIVIDEYGTTEGIVTAADLLEAIVGALPSNYGADESAQIVKREDGSWLVDGLTPVDEICLTLGLDAFEEDADYKTIAGFVIEELGREPTEGDTFEKMGFRFEVIDMDGRRIDKVLISRIEGQVPFYN